jgi:hypothetical protein
MANMAMTMSDLTKLGRTEDSSALDRTKVRDIESGQVSGAVYWSCDEVANFIETLGFPQYQVCFDDILYVHIL